MYADPSLIRTHTVAVRFNRKEAALVNALIDYTGGEKAAFIRDLVLRAAVEFLHDSDRASSGQNLREG